MALWNKKLYPLVAILAGLFIIVFGLVMARELLACSVFLAAVFVWLLLFGCWKSCLHALLFRDILRRNGHSKFGLGNGKPLRRGIPRHRSRYVHHARKNDEEPFAGAYAALGHARHAHRYVLCSYAQRGDKKGARGNENARRGQRTQS